jgi:hypothetical protein
VGDPFAALHGLYWLVANLAIPGPIVLACDDLHWADEPSLRWLVYFCHRLEGLPALVAGHHPPTTPGALAAAGRAARDGRGTDSVSRAAERDRSHFADAAMARWAAW